MEKIYYIYRIKNNKTGRMYIGCTDNPSRRWECQGYRYKTNKEFYSDIQNYGWENFTKEVLCEACNRKLAHIFETHFIKFFNTLEKGYNRDFSTERSTECKKKLSDINKGKVLSEEHKKQISEAKKGKVLSEDHKKRISESCKGEKHPLYGKHLSDETKRKISEARKGLLVGDKHPLYGKHHSDETKRKISEARKGISVGDKNHNAKKVVDVKTGKEYSCLKYCVEDLGVNYKVLRTGLSKNLKKYQHIQYI